MCYGAHTERILQILEKYVGRPKGRRGSGSAVAAAAAVRTAVPGEQRYVGVKDSAVRGVKGRVGDVDRELRGGKVRENRETGEDGRAREGRQGGDTIVGTTAAGAATGAAAGTTARAAAGTPAGAGIASARPHIDDPSVCEL